MAPWLLDGQLGVLQFVLPFNVLVLGSLHRLKLWLDRLGRCQHSQDDSHGLLGKHNDVDLKQCGYGLARKTHVTSSPLAPMVRWRLVHRLGLGFCVYFCTWGLHMWESVLQGIGNGTAAAWSVVFGWPSGHLAN